jgi:hypothetical protein
MRNTAPFKSSPFAPTTSMVHVWPEAPGWDKRL